MNRKYSLARSLMDHEGNPWHVHQKLKIRATGIEMRDQVQRQHERDDGNDEREGANAPNVPAIKEKKQDRSQHG
jgi:hypothetical protein